jgi:replicative DNA helicase
VTVFKLALISPGDVSEERASAERIVKELNASVARAFQCRFQLWRWETDSRPGLHLEGPQGSIDRLMNLEDVDLVIGLFWNRFGTPTKDAKSGTEHELRRAWELWNLNGHPDVMLYLCNRATHISTSEQLEQKRRVIEFWEQMPKEQGWAEYESPEDFASLLKNHLILFLEEHQTVTSQVGDLLLNVSPAISEEGIRDAEETNKREKSAENPNNEAQYPQQSFRALRDLLTENMEVLERQYETGSDLTGLSSGFTDLDNLTAGLQPSSLIVIAARPAFGKSSLAMSMALHAGAELQVPVLIFSLDMSKSELTHRMMCAESRVDGNRLRRGTLVDSDWPKLAHALGRLADAPIFIDDTDGLSVADMRIKCELLKARHGLGLVIVDPVELVHSTGTATGDSQMKQVADTSRLLKNLAREFKLPVVAIVQLSQALERRADKRPLLTDLDESGNLERDADMVLFIYRDEVYKPDSPEIGIAEILVAKHRYGPTGKFPLVFLQHFTKFANLARST